RLRSETMGTRPPLPIAAELMDGYQDDPGPRRGDTADVARATPRVSLPLPGRERALGKPRIQPPPTYSAAVFTAGRSGRWARISSATRNAISSAWLALRRGSQ